MLPFVLILLQLFGCTATLLNGPDKDTQRWYVKVWTRGKDGQQEIRLYSVRDGKDRKKALKDCDRWMGQQQRKANKHGEHKTTSSH